MLISQFFMRFFATSAHIGTEWLGFKIGEARVPIFRVRDTRLDTKSMSSYFETNWNLKLRYIIYVHFMWLYTGCPINCKTQVNFLLFKEFFFHGCSLQYWRLPIYKTICTYQQEALITPHNKSPSQSQPSTTDFTLFFSRFIFTSLFLISDSKAWSRPNPFSSKVTYLHTLSRKCHFLFSACVHILEINTRNVHYWQHRCLVKCHFMSRSRHMLPDRILKKVFRSRLLHFFK